MFYFLIVYNCNDCFEVQCEASSPGSSRAIACEMRTIELCVIVNSVRFDDRALLQYSSST